MPDKHGLSREALLELKRISPWRSLASIAWTWSLIAACFALYIARPHPVTAIVGIVIVSGRQLGLAVLMHEGAHHLLLPNRAWNDRVSDWLTAAPLCLSTLRYRKEHLQHHKYTWTDKDPDRWLAEPFPVTRRSFARKLARDLAGIAGLRRWLYQFATFGGVTARDQLRVARLPIIAATFARRQWRFLAVNGAMIGACAALGHVEAWPLLWALPNLTGYSLVLRLRSIAEHAAVGDIDDELRQTRTTLTSWWVELLMAPHHVNYHLEHHLYLFIPHYNLPRAHALLREAGTLDRAEVARGYTSVWRRAMSGQGKPQPGATAA